MLYGDAWKSIQENRSVVLGYIISVVIFSFCYGLLLRGLESYVEPKPEGNGEKLSQQQPQEVDALTQDGDIAPSEEVSETPPKSAPPEPSFWKAVLRMFATVLNASMTAVLQAIFFARIGMRIDRPLWRCSGPLDALQRFFMPWFILNLFMLALMQVALRFSVTPAAIFFEILSMTGFIVMIPIGACIMYHGRLHWPEMPIAIRPIVSQFSLAMAVMVITYLEYTLLLLLQYLLIRYEVFRSSVLLSALVNAPFAFIECFAFAAMWRVCMIHRDSLSDEDPYADL